MRSSKERQGLASLLALSCCFLDVHVARNCDFAPGRGFEYNSDSENEGLVSGHFGLCLRCERVE